MRPGQLFLYDAPDGQPRPPYRFLPDVTIPSGLTTNQIGWRGPPIENPRPERTVRIVFVGSSTVVEAHHLPYSWPEYVGHWMNVWSRAKGLGIRFEVLNAGRESINSTDIAAVVRTEVLPLRPDLVVYHEGGNQFRLASIVDKVPDDPRHPPVERAGAGGREVAEGSRALFRPDRPRPGRRSPWPGPRPEATAAANGPSPTTRSSGRKGSTR